MNSMKNTLRSIIMNDKAKLPFRKILRRIWHYFGIRKSIRNRTRLALSYFGPQLELIRSWARTSRENDNFTYDLTPLSKNYLASMIAVVVSAKPDEISRCFAELEGDEELRHFLVRMIRKHPDKLGYDDSMHFGRRIGWYAFVRRLKPKLVIETGVDKGLGSCIISCALMRNAAEGAPGSYIGTDINPEAGLLYTRPYSRYGTIVYGDSIQSLKKIRRTIDIFINDSDHSPDYEKREYEAIRSKLVPGKSVVLGDNSHATSELFNFASRTSRRFLFFAEKPLNHWYPGCGLGIAYY